MDLDKVDVSELYTAALQLIRMKVHEFNAFEPNTTAEAMAYSLGRRALTGEASAFEMLLRLAALAREGEELADNPDPLSLALTNLAEQIESVRLCKAE